MYNLCTIPIHAGFDVVLQHLQALTHQVISNQELPRTQLSVRGVQAGSSSGAGLALESLFNYQIDRQQRCACAVLSIVWRKSLNDE